MAPSGYCGIFPPLTLTGPSTTQPPMETLRRFRWRILPRLAALLLVLLAQCASYRARPIDPAVTAAALTRRSLSDPRLLRFFAIDQRHQDPPRWNLETLTLVALYERPEMPIAEATLQAAAAGEITAAMLPNPVLSLSAKYDTTTSLIPW